MQGQGKSDRYFETSFSLNETNIEKSKPSNDSKDVKDGNTAYRSSNHTNYDTNLNMTHQTLHNTYVVNFKV